MENKVPEPHNNTVSTRALERKLAREIASRKQAEQLLEQKSLELFQANQKLEVAVAQLERSSQQNMLKLEFQKHIDALLIYFGRAFLNHHLDDVLISNLVRRLTQTPLICSSYVKLNPKLNLELQKPHYGSSAIAKDVVETQWQDRVLHIRLLAKQEDIGILSIEVIETDYDLEFVQRSFQLVAALLAGAVNRQLIIDRNIESRKKAEQSEQSTRDFLAMINHELRTPLNGLLGSAELLSQTPLDAHQDVLLNNLSQSGQFLRVIINDLLDFSKINTGMFELIPNNFEMCGLINTLRSIFSQKAIEKSLEFSIDSDTSLPSLVNGDRERITQVFVNLIGNAIRFTDRGFVSVKFSWHNNILSFEVSDSGIGINASDFDKLFQPFTQADRSSKRNFEGTGLGLAICNQLLDLMGGDIQFESEVNVGTRFYGHLPLHKAEQSAPSLAQTTKQRTTELPQSTKILVVEDITVNQIIIKQMLIKIGITPDIMPSGIDALDAIKASHYDLILMDCRMPGMDGFETTSKIRQLGFTLPIVALTASTTAAERELCFESGMDDILTKPYTSTELSNVLSKWLLDE